MSSLKYWTIIIISIDDKLVADKIKDLNSKSNKRAVKDFLRLSGAVHGGDRALNIAANRFINGEIKQIVQDADKFKKIVEAAVEKASDTVSDKAKDAAKSAVQEK